MASVVVVMLMIMVMMRLFASVSVAMMRLFFMTMTVVRFLVLVTVAVMCFLVLVAMATMLFLVLMAMAMMLFLVLMAVTMMRFLVLMAMAMRHFLFLMAMAVMCFFVLVTVMLFLLRGCSGHRCQAIEVGHIMVMILMGCIQNDIEITARNAGFLDAGDLHHEAVRRDGIQRAFQRLRVCAEVDHRCDEHISADAGGSFKV